MLNIVSVFKAKMLHYFSHTSRSITKINYIIKRVIQLSH